MKKLIKRNLPLNETYNFVGISDIGEIGSTCDNCGKLIRYVAELKSSSNKTYYVGTECAKTLSQCSINNEFSMLEQFNAMKKVATANNLVHNGSDLKIWGYYDKRWILIVGKNKNGKVIKIVIERQFDLFLQSYYKFVDSFINNIFETHDVILNTWCFNDIFTYFNKLKNN